MPEHTQATGADAEQRFEQAPDVVTITADHHGAPPVVRLGNIDDSPVTVRMSGYEPTSRQRTIGRHPHEAQAAGQAAAAAAAAGAEVTTKVVEPEPKREAKPASRRASTKKH
jgi:hypothetical protein